MSIFHNPKLLKELIENGADFEQKFLKTAADPTYQDLAGIALKYTTQLLRAADPAEYKSPPQITSGTDEPVNIKVDDLQNLSKLLEFLRNNKISFNGKQIAYLDGTDPLPDYLSKAKDDKTVLVFTGKPLREDSIVPDTKGKREWVGVRYVVDRAAIVGYLTSLQELAKDNKVLQVMVGKLIQQASIEGAKELSTEPKETKSSTISDDTVVDGFTTPVIDFNNAFDGTATAPNFDGTPIKLTVADIKSQESFNGWLQRNQIKFKSKDGKIKSSADMDICSFMSVMFARAKLLQSRYSTSPEFTKSANYYIAQVQVIGSQYEDSNGNKCRVGSATSTTTAPTTGTGGKITADQLDRIVKTLPLSVNEINFTKINTFLQYIAEAMPTQVATYKPTIDAGMTNTNSISTQPGMLTLSMTPEQIKFKLTNAQSSYCPYLEQMKMIISSVQELIGIFKSSFEEELRRNPAYWELVVAQVGQYEEDSYSVAKRNINRLSYLMRSGGCPRS